MTTRAVGREPLLYGTQIKRLPYFSNLSSLHTLSLRGLELESLRALSYLSNLVELDLNGLKISSSQVFRLDFLESLGKLQTLDLSRTPVEKLPDISKLTSLRKLLLANCQHLKAVPDPQSTNLEVLDLSLPEPDDSTATNCHVETETQEGHVQAVAAGNGNFQQGSVQGEGQISGAAEIHIVSLIRNQLSISDQFIHDFRNLYAQISDIQKNFTSAKAIPSTGIANSNKYNQHFEKQLKMLHKDLMYIQENIEMLQNSRNCHRCEELLQELMEVIAQLSSIDSSTDLVNLKQLLRVVLMLKLLVPPKEANTQTKSKITGKRKQSSVTRSMNMEYATVADIYSLECHDQERLNLLSSSYRSLTDIQKYCLLSFSAFPCNEHEDNNTGVMTMKSLVIKKKILIFLWAGEGIIDTYREDNTALADTDNKVSQGISTTQQANRPNTIEDEGMQILKVLTDKGFIEHVIKNHRKTGRCRMLYFVHCFVTAIAKGDGFLNFSKLTPYFIRSKRDCLLTFQDSFLPSSSKLQAKCTSSQKEVYSWSSVLTLFNHNESVVDVKPEWFSKMKHLSVLCLGNWNSENAKHIEVVDEKFLKDLEKMKQLRYLSLQGWSTIKKLPDSVCKLANLKILDLRECSYLEELPANIGSLKSLTHLDITNCILITKLPKGISLLPKLEVLKGFAVNHQACDSEDEKVFILDHWWEKTKRCVIHGLFRRKNHEVCTLKDLLKIEKLRELSLVVKLSRLLDDEFVDVFKEMRGLSKLKILWERSFSESEDMKCWYPRPSRISTKEISRINHLQTLEKLELLCLPLESTPFWLDPGNMKNLKKLYIIGGSLKTMPDFEEKWNVTTLRLRYLNNFYISWLDLKRSFPYLTYLECYQCKLLGGIPSSEDGVWRAESDGNESS